MSTLMFTVVEPVDHLEETHTEDSHEATSDDCVNIQAPVLSGISSEINLVGDLTKTLHSLFS